ncbi:MAG: hypothetical protein KC609_04965, partial [Myxococcales bacterium]|nr:hypothetical protein [Myxococcales bacterium]
TELHSATRSVTLPGDALRLIEQLNRRPARSTEVELAPSELAPKSLQRFLGALRRVRLVPTKRRVKSGLIWRISVDDRSLLALTERVRLAGLVFRGRTLRAK